MELRTSLVLIVRVLSTQQQSLEPLSLTTATSSIGWAGLGHEAADSHRKYWDIYSPSHCMYCTQFRHTQNVCSPCWGVWEDFLKLACGNPQFLHVWVGWGLPSSTENLGTSNSLQASLPVTKIPCSLYLFWIITHVRQDAKQLCTRLILVLSNYNTL